jgi:hypothetical protein
MARGAPPLRKALGERADTIDDRSVALGYEVHECQGEFGYVLITPRAIRLKTFSDCRFETSWKSREWIAETQRFARSDARQ